jgi:YegS/Rv2252/BmrU family lipid kinase
VTEAAIAFDETLIGAGTDIRRVALCANPASGGYSPRRIAAVAAALRAEGVDVDVRHSAAPGDLERMAADPMLACDLLLVSGGDGSINEVVAGLARRTGGKPRLAVVPAGTANVLADELKLPRRASAIARAILAGKTVPLHHGLANGRPFVLMASAGLDAAVVHGVPPEMKRRFKQLAFVATAFRLGFTRRPQDLRVIADGEPLVGRLAIVTNARCYGGPFTLCRDASVTRPGLTLVLAHDDRPTALMRLAAGLVFGRLKDGPGLTMRPVRHVRFEAAEPVEVQIDGEAHGTTPLDIHEGAEALRIVVA